MASALSDLEIETELTFNNTDYVVTMKPVQVTTFDPNLRLFIEVEEKLTGNLWRGDFQQKYIEDISQKAGCPKKFNVFLKMLNSAFKCETEQVYIDLLTFQDLENLKNKKQTNTSVNTSQANNKKRYMILTYVGEFERVHYPLPLNFIEEPEPDSLRRTIERMRSQISMQRSGTFSAQSSQQQQQPFSKQNTNTFSKVDDFESIETENEHLKRQITELESQFSQSHSEFYTLSQQKSLAESEYDKYKREALRELQQLQDQVRNAESELNQLQEHLRSTVSQNPGNRVTATSGFSLNSGQVMGGSQVSDVDHVKRQLEEVNTQLTQEKSTTGSLLEQQEKEIEECKKELDEHRTNEQKLKLKQKELQDELEYTLKRIEQLQRGITTPVRRRPAGTGTSPYSRNSSGTKKQTTPTNAYNKNQRNPSNPGLRQNSNTRTSPTTYNRTNQPKPPATNRFARVSPGPAARQTGPGNTSQTRTQNRSGSNNARGLGPSQRQPQKPVPYQSKQAQPSGGSSVYDRLYGGNNKGSRAQDQQQPQRKTSGSIGATANPTYGGTATSNTEPVNINIESSLGSSGAAVKRAENKENQALYQPAQQETVAQPTGSYDDVDVKDINSKLSRLQDLLKMAKQT